MTKYRIVYDPAYGGISNSTIHYHAEYKTKFGFWRYLDDSWASSPEEVEKLIKRHKENNVPRTIIKYL